MSRRTYVTKRIVFTIFALYLVMSVTFGFIMLTANPMVARVAHGAAQQARNERANETERKQMVQEVIDEYKEEHNLDEPLLQSYTRWLIDITTFDWGTSYSHRAPVMAVLSRTIPTTLAYVIPAMMFALLGGIGLGVYSALNPGTAMERLVTGGSYLGFSIPNYWLATVATFLGARTLVVPFISNGTIMSVVLPAAILGTSLLAGQLRYARAESHEYVYSEFVKLLRAKGASNLRVARHILRNAAIPLLSLFFADLIGVLIVNVFVLEHVLRIPGIGRAGLFAMEQRDLPLIIGIALTIAFAGIVGNLVQDLAYSSLDPRVDAE
ncbi:ABC transporter permease [Haladaptatus sp. NG-SE-30]